MDINLQAEFAGIEVKIYYDFNLWSDSFYRRIFKKAYYAKSIEYVKDTAGGVTFDSPRLIWMSDGNNFLDKDKDASWVRRHIPRNARPATVNDGIASAIVNLSFRKQLEDHPISLAGTYFIDHYSTPDMSYLYNQGGKTTLYRGDSDSLYPTHGFALSGG